MHNLSAKQVACKGNFKCGYVLLNIVSADLIILETNVRLFASSVSAGIKKIINHDISCE